MGMRRIKARPYGNPAQVIPEKADESAYYAIARILMAEFGYDGHTGVATVLEQIGHYVLREHDVLKRAIPELAKRNGKKLPEELTTLPKE